MSNKYKSINKPSINSQHKQGYYEVINPEKYIGNPNEVIYRSSWEYKFCIYCDTTPSVTKWSSEPTFSPFPIKYYNPISNTVRNYYVDFYLRVLDEDGTERDYIAEVKPKNQTKIPDPITGNKTLKKLKSYNYLLESFLVNDAKSTAAQQFAALHGWEYMVVTEDFIK